MPLNRMRDKGLPDVDGFSASPEELLTRMIATYEAVYQRETGTAVTLSAGNESRVRLYSVALILYQQENLIRYLASQNFIAYSSGGYLDHISATRGGPRRAEAAKAVVTMRFAFSAPVPSGYMVPRGTRVTPDGVRMFALESACAVPFGAKSWEHLFECQVAGTVGNGYLQGQIATLVDPLPYVQAVANIDLSQGGTDVQSDDDFAELVYLAPEGYAVAGPEMAYLYMARQFSTSIMDAKAYCNAPGEVTVVTLLQGGEIPEPAFLSALLGYLNAKGRRPLTDFVHTAAPEIVNYTVEFTWYLLPEDELQGVETKVLEATKAYIGWQKAKMGRSVNPQELISRVRAAGASRLEIVGPVEKVVPEYGVALAEGAPIVRFGGVERA